MNHPTILLRLLFALFVVFSCFSCKKESKSFDACDADICSDSRKVYKKIDSLTGTVLWDVIGQEARFSMYVLNDSNNAKESYLLCEYINQGAYPSYVNLLGNEYELGTRVIFSGVVKDNCDTAIFNTQNEEMRYITITDIKKKYCTKEYAVDKFRNDTLKRRWEFIGFVINSDSIDYPPCEGNGATIQFKETPFDTSSILLSCSGGAPVNSFGGAYLLNGNDSITITEITRTLVAGNSIAMDYEGKYLGRLEIVNRYKIENNLLTLYNDSENIEMLFQALD